MIATAAKLWRGEIALAYTFWRHAVCYGLLVNLATHVAMLALIANDVAAIWIVLAVVLPLPYNIFLFIAVWRSAAHFQGEAKWADVARIAAPIWLLFLTLL